MKPFKILLSFVVSIFVLFSANAAEEEKMKDTYTYATYFVCEPENEKAIDDLVAKSYAPIYDAAVKDGTIKNWGWLAHHTGGEWRRILYHSAGSVGDTLKAQKTIGMRMDKALGSAPDAMATGCSTHDDNIWKRVTGGSSDASAMRGKASISTYWNCDIFAEETADEVVKNHFSKVYNNHVGKGKLTSWGWLSHAVGGEYRRLFTMSAENYDDLFAAQSSILKTIYGEGESKPAMDFIKACSAHVDYLWDVKH